MVSIRNITTTTCPFWFVFGHCSWCQQLFCPYNLNYDIRIVENNLQACMNSNTLLIRSICDILHSKLQNYQGYTWHKMWDFLCSISSCFIPVVLWIWVRVAIGKFSHFVFMWPFCFELSSLSLYLNYNFYASKLFMNKMSEVYESIHVVLWFLSCSAISQPLSGREKSSSLCLLTCTHTMGS